MLALFIRETFSYIYFTKRKNGEQKKDRGAFEQAKKCPLIVDDETTEPGSREVAK